MVLLQGWLVIWYKPRHNIMANPATTSGLFVTFGDSGSRKQNCHERGEGGGLESPY